MSELSIEEIAANLRDVDVRIEDACRRSRRSRDEVRMIGVTKTKPVALLRMAVETGITDLGENYVQELVEKNQVLGAEFNNRAHWHFIGHLQRNKVKYIAPFVHMVHAVDSERLGAELNKQAEQLGRRIPILLQVNTSGEDSKYGVPPDAVSELARSLASFPHLDLQGMMTLAAYLDDPEATRPMFQLLRETRNRVSSECSLPLPHLSMGMTNDFEVAIEEGATMVRIGTALFGERQKG